ncbi:hypothetical protein [Streptacidiphilus cavernicola]|uniref:Uncharacterized protein n=1 Tax=Streptacidiphilus cavernicola TaxID=3342716 RepID=A0ABV6VY14_9ACTN
MNGHELATVAHRRARCSLCRATWTSQAAARSAAATWPCFGEPLLHGHVLDREHWTGIRWHGRTTDALCDDTSCRNCFPLPACPCHACDGTLIIRALSIVVQDGYQGPFVSASEIPDMRNEPELRRQHEERNGIEP